MYAFWVGAGADLDGKLNDALLLEPIGMREVLIMLFRIGCLSTARRNFVPSHSTDVYENNCMTKRFRQDLAKLRFGTAAGSNDLVFVILHDLCIQVDSGAY